MKYSFITIFSEVTVNHFCFCQLDFEAVIAKNSKRIIHFAESTSYYVECASMSLTSPNNENELKGAIQTNFEKAIELVPCRAPRE